MLAQAKVIGDEIERQAGHRRCHEQAHRPDARELPAGRVPLVRSSSSRSPPWPTSTPCTSSRSAGTSTCSCAPSTRRSRNNLEERLENIIAQNTISAYRNVCRSLYEKDKLLFSFVMCTNIMRGDGTLDADQFTFFLTGGAGCCPTTRPRTRRAA